MATTFGISDYQAQIAAAQPLAESNLEAIRKAAQGIIAKAEKAIKKIQENTALLGDGVPVLAGDHVFAFQLPQFDKTGNIVRLRIIERVVDMVKKDQDGRGYVYFGTIKEGERASTVDDVAMDTSSKAKRYDASKWFASREAAIEAASAVQSRKLLEAEKAVAREEELLNSVRHDEPTDFDLTTPKSLVLDEVTA